MPIKHQFTAVANTSTIKAEYWNAEHTVDTTALVPNLNADYLDGSHLSTLNADKVDGLHANEIGGVGSLSQLTINVSKDWQGYGITNLGPLTFSTDVNLYRGGADTLRTDDTFSCNKLLTDSNALVSNLNADLLDGAHIYNIIGWNEIVNPGFEYGRWRASGGFGAPSTIDSHSGRYCHYIATASSIEGWESYPSWINLAGESSFILSIWMKGTQTLSDGNPVLYFDKASDQYGTGIEYVSQVGFYGPMSLPTWIQYYGTMPVDPAKPWVRPTLYFKGIGTMKFDDCMIIKGNQLTSFVDNTTAKERWIPDFYYSKETVQTAEWSNPSGNTIILSLTIPVDYRTRGLVFLGGNFYLKNGADAANAYWGWNLDGTQQIALHLNIYAEGASTVGSFQSPSWADDVILSIGSHTLSLWMSVPLGGTIYASSRYIRILFGSYFV